MYKESYKTNGSTSLSHIVELVEYSGKYESQRLTTIMIGIYEIIQLSLHVQVHLNRVCVISKQWDLSVVWDYIELKK